MIPNVLTIAGSDSGGGAGIQADLKTFSALGAYGCSAITALTAQNTRGVHAIQDVPADFVTAQLDAVFEDLEIHAVKIGMLSSPEIIRAVADGLERHRARNVVLDPVMVAKSGDRLLHPDAVEALRAEIVPRCALLTPNLPEAGVLLGAELVDDAVGMTRAALALLETGAAAVLVKGGHLGGDESPDLLADGEEEPLVLGAPRVPTENTHGTGCTLSSAIAAHLGHGKPLREAVTEAKEYVTEALQAADRLDVGQGHGPLHHFHHWW